MVRSHTITDTESKSSLKIPIKLTDADQILHISVTDLSLTPPTSSDKIIQLKDIRSMNDTTQSFVNFNLPRIRHAPIFSDDFILWNGDYSHERVQLNVSQIVCQLSSMRSHGVNRSKQPYKVMFSMYFADLYIAKLYWDIPSTYEIQRVARFWDTVVKSYDKVIWYCFRRLTIHTRSIIISDR
jgi:hypothetical protein